MSKRNIIILYSYHHGNTKKVAEAMAGKLNSIIMEIAPNGNSISFPINEYDLIGFGSGIDSGKHYSCLLNYAESLPPVQNKQAFIFSTSGIYNHKKMIQDHTALRTILQNKGFEIVAEFSCAGFNTNGFLKLFGGMNKGRPNVEDLKNAEEFAGNL